MTQTVTSDSWLHKALETEIKHRALEIIQHECQEAQKRVEERMRALADEIALKILGYYTVERHGPNLVITVEKKLGEENGVLPQKTRSR